MKELELLEEMLIDADRKPPPSRQEKTCAPSPTAKRTYKNVTLEGPVAGGKTSLKQPTRETCSACETCWQSTAAPSLT
eukprot:2887479-Rhodomonas_salina.2